MRRILLLVACLPLLAATGQKSGTQTVVDPQLTVKDVDGTTVLRKSSDRFSHLVDHTSGWVNVKSYGAVADRTGSGGTDNGPAIQAALNAAGIANRTSPAVSSTVFIPAGQYRVINPNFTIPNGVRIKGAGKGATRLFFTGMTSADYAFKFESATGEAWGQVEDLYIYAGGGNGIKFGQGSQFYSFAKNVETEAPYRGIEITYTYGVKVEDVTVRRAADWSFYIHDNSNTAQGPTTITLEHVDCEDWSKGNLYVKGTSGLRVLNSIFEGASSPVGGDNILLDQGASGGGVNVALFQGNWFETVQTTSAFVNHIRITSDRSGSDPAAIGVTIAENSFGGGLAGTTNADVKIEGGQNLRIENNYSVSGAAKFVDTVVTPTMFRISGNYGPSTSKVPRRMYGGEMRSSQNVTGTPINLSSDYGERQVLNCFINAVNFTISNPIANFYTPIGARMVVTIADLTPSGMGTVTWSSGYKMAAWTNPARLYQKTITFEYDGTVWRELWRSSDVPAN